MNRKQRNLVRAIGYIVLLVIIFFMYVNALEFGSNRIDEYKQKRVIGKQVYRLSSRSATEVNFESLKPIVEMEVSAYCSCVECCGKSDGITASGKVATEGRTIAADTDMYPIGTLLYLEGIGFRTVEDRGGAIQGNKLDLFFASHKDALEFGRKTIKVEVVR